MRILPFLSPIEITRQIYSALILHSVQRRRFALSALGLERFVDRFSTESVSFYGPFLFGGNFMEMVDEELVMHKRASDIARKVAPLSVNPGTPSPFERPFFRLGFASEAFRVLSWFAFFSRFSWLLPFRHVW